MLFMLLSKGTAVRLTDEQASIIGHMTYAASMLWNICKYERRNYKELDLEKHPNWYYQKSAPPKCVLQGIRFVKVQEAYRSQCSPLLTLVLKQYALNITRQVVPLSYNCLTAQPLHCQQGQGEALILL